MAKTDGERFIREQRLLELDLMFTVFADTFARTSFAAQGAYLAMERAAAALFLAASELERRDNGDSGEDAKVLLDMGIAP